MSQDKEFNDFLNTNFSYVDNQATYQTDADYSTNAGSYYEDLARKQRLIELMARKIWDYDKELAIRFAAWDKNLEEFDDEVLRLLQEWMDDGTFKTIIDDHIFKEKANITWVNSELATLRTAVNKQISDFETANNTRFITFETNMNSKLSDLKQGNVYVLDYGAKGDGVTDDTAAIQAALNVASGKTVYFPNRVFIIKGMLKVKSNTKIVMQKNTVLKRGSDVNCLIINDSDGVTGGYGTQYNITIEGGVIDVNRQAFPSKCSPVAFGHAMNITITDVSFKNMWQWHYIELNAVKGALIERCTFDGHEVSAVSEHVQIDLAIGSNAFPWFGPYDFTPCADITIKDNTFKNGERGVGTHSASSGVYHKNIIITNNTFQNMKKECIAVYDYKNSVISGNYCEDAFTGIAIANSADNSSHSIQIIDNHIVDMYKDINSRGIQLNDRCFNIVVRGNRVDNINRHGIGIDRSNNIVCDGNIVSRCRLTGIYLYGSFDVVCTNNISSRNNTDLAAEEFDIRVGQNVGVSGTDYVIANNNVDTLGLMKSLNCGVFQNHIAKLTQGTTNTDLKMVNNCIGGIWV